jgi:hypothetical protein
MSEGRGLVEGRALVRRMQLLRTHYVNKSVVLLCSYLSFSSGVDIRDTVYHGIRSLKLLLCRCLSITPLILSSALHTLAMHRTSS